MATLLAKNADVVVTMDGRRRELKNAGVFARDGVIEQVGLAAELPSTADRILDLRARPHPASRDDQTATTIWIRS